MVLVLVALVATACSDDGSSFDAAGSSTTSPTTTVAAATTTSTDGSASTTSQASTTTATTTVPETTTIPVTTEAADTLAPPAPTAVVCQAGGGSGEFGLEWDAPADTSDILGIKIYVDDGTGFSRLRKLPLADGLVSTNLAGGTRWGAVAWPVPARVPIELAVTTYDAAGNESGWNPVDAYYAAGATPCNSGPPPAPTIVAIDHGGGSGEIEVNIAPPALDVVSYLVWMDQGSGMVPMNIYGPPQPSYLDPSYDWVTAEFANWSLSSTFRVVAVDAHGNQSPPTDMPCGPIPGINDSC